MNTLLDICKTLKETYKVFQSKDCNNEWLGISLPHGTDINTLKSEVDDMLEPVGIECNIPTPTAKKPVPTAVFVRVNGVSLEDIHKTLDGSAEAQADSVYYQEALSLLS